MRFGTRASARLFSVLGRPRIREVHVVLVPLVTTLVFTVITEPDWKAILLAVVVSLVVWLAIVNVAFRRVRRLVDDYTQAFARGDVELMAELAPLIPQLEHFTDPRLARASALARTGERLMIEGRWEEARVVLSEANVRGMPAANRAGVLNNLAYATARLGGPDAVWLAESAMAAAKEAGLDDGAMRATLGTALAKAARYEEALPLLVGSAAVSENGRSKNDRMYWLGVVYRALGRKDDAREAFGVAAALEGPCKEEARAALDDDSPFRS